MWKFWPKLNPFWLGAQLLHALVWVIPETTVTEPGTVLLGGEAVLPQLVTRTFQEVGRQLVHPLTFAVGGH
jgi:hypothetical protein